MAGKKNIQLEVQTTSDTTGIKQTEKAIDNLGEKSEGAFSKGVRGVADFGLALQGLQMVGDLFTSALANADISGTLQAQLGTTTEAAGELGRIAGELYGENFGQSLQDVGTAVTNVARNIGDVGKLGAEGLKEASAAALVLRDTFELDVAQSTKAVGQMLKTGLVKDAQQGFDLITVAMQQIPGAADDGLDTLNEYSTQFRKLGVDGPMAMGLIAQGMKAGARDTDIVADAIKEFSIRAVDGSKLSAEGFKALGLDAQKMTKQFAAGGEGASKGLDMVLDRLRAMKDPVAQSQAAVALFGTQAEDLGAALFSLDPSTATAGLGELAGASQRAADAMAAGPTAQIEAAKRAFMEWATNIIGGIVVPAITSFVGFLNATLVPVLSAIVGWLKDNWSWLSVVLAVIAAMAAPIVAVSLAMSAWAKIMELVKLAQIALNLAMAANPILLVVSLIAGLIAAFVLLWNKSAAFRDFFIGVWDAIKAGVGNAIDWLKRAWDSVIRAFQDSVAWFGRIGDSIGTAISNGVKGAINWVIGILNGFIRGVNSIIDGLNNVPGVSLGHIPQIPRLARGGLIAQGGLAIVGERGRELVSLPGGARVHPNSATESALGGGGGTLVKVFIGDQELTSIVRTEVVQMSENTARRTNAGTGRNR